MNPFKLSDYIAAAAPTIAGLTLSEWNSLAGLCGSLLGIAFLIWKWRRDAKSKRDSSLD